jgi:hypothetical protein
MNGQHILACGEMRLGDAGREIPMVPLAPGVSSSRTEGAICAGVEGHIPLAASPNTPRPVRMVEQREPI